MGKVSGNFSKTTPQILTTMEQTKACSSPQASGNSAHTETAPASGPRRSGRARKHPALFTDDKAAYVDEFNKSPTENRLAVQQAKANSEGPMTNGHDSDVRRNPKRKAAPEHFDVPENLLEESLAPIRRDEQAEWDGWVELESDPAFFNVLVKDLGVQDVKVQDIFGVDSASLAELPKPVLGLVFCYQYVEDASPEATDDQSVWFATQMTDNACATVALVNILMNAHGIDLGDMLSNFKAKTAPLAPPIRGLTLSTNTDIRVVHNSLARRLDFLNADLFMKNEVDEFRRKKIRLVNSSKRPKKKRKPLSDAAFHFVAYVPVGNKVWQLDGLESNPLCIGEFKDNWTAVAGTFIEAKMLQYESDDGSFNLLALCRNPLGTLRHELVRNIRSMEELECYAASGPERANTVGVDGAGPGCVTRTDVDGLSKFGLKPQDLDSDANEDKSTEVLEQISKQNLDLVSVTDLREKLRGEQARIQAAFAAELHGSAEDVSLAGGRKKDYTAVIHGWMKKLVEHGVAQRLQAEVDLLKV